MRAFVVGSVATAYPLRALRVRYSDYGVWIYIHSFITFLVTYGYVRVQRRVVRECIDTLGANGPARHLSSIKRVLTFKRLGHTLIRFLFYDPTGQVSASVNEVGGFLVAVLVQRVGYEYEYCRVAVWRMYSIGGSHFVVLL